MSDESLPRRWGRFLPSKARVVQRALSAAFPTRSERHQAVAGKASAAEALRSSEDIEAFGGVDEAQAESKRRPGKKSKAPSSRDVEHSGFVGAQAELEPSIGPDGEVYEHEVTVEGEPTPIEEKLETGEELTPDPTAAAFFDVDNTLTPARQVSESPCPLRYMLSIRRAGSVAGDDHAPARAAQEGRHRRRRRLRLRQGLRAALL